MNNKVLIKVIVPELSKTFDVYIPVNERVWKIKKLIIKSVCDLTRENLDLNKEYGFINKNSGKMYDSNDIIIETDIKTGTEIIIITAKSVNKQ